MNIRSYNQQDKQRILQLSSRLSEISFLEHRDSEQMQQKQLEMAQASIDENSDNIFVAEEEGVFLGYIECKGEEDYFSKEKLAYISAIAITAEGEGKGVGKQLMRFAETWAHERGIKVLVLDVFSENQRAVQFYEHIGYSQEIVKMTKVIGG
ncbi:GNAT family N-acetyltransferase [Cytobacillus sp. FSL R7-0680]|uniref:GNAT family N-acetyltransferase n=1 Tax=Cytobacillus sp. FSL R7-0680 TaxID=2921689 RepID=UPI0030F62233